MKLIRLLLAPLRIWMCNHSLIWQLTRRALATRYRGSLLGVAWSILQPLALLAAYTFVFHTVLDAKWDQFDVSRGDGGAAAFAVPLFSGLILFWWTSECLQIAPNVVINHTNFVKKTIFPLPILPLPAFLVAGFHALVSSAVLVAFLAMRGELAPTAWAYPLVLLSFVPYMLGAMWMLASLGVYLRDLQHIINLVVMMLMFLTPIFYPISAVPIGLQDYLHLNPLTFAVEQARAALIWGEGLMLGKLGIFFAAGWLFASLGLGLFLALKRDFADVL